MGDEAMEAVQEMTELLAGCCATAFLKRSDLQKFFKSTFR